MIGDVQFQPVGFIKGSFKVDPRTAFTLNSQEEVQALWENLPKSDQTRFSQPQIDFASKKLLVVTAPLCSISCFLLVEKMEMVAKDTLQIIWGEVSERGAAAAAWGVAYQFLAVERPLEFSTEVHIGLELEMLEDFDPELQALGKEIDERGYNYPGRKKLWDSYDEKMNHLKERCLGPALRIAQPQNVYTPAADPAAVPAPAPHAAQPIEFALQNAIVRLEDIEL